MNVCLNKLFLILYSKLEHFYTCCVVNESGFVGGALALKVGATYCPQSRHGIVVVAERTMEYYIAHVCTPKLQGGENYRLNKYNKAQSGVRENYNLCPMTF